MIDVSTILGKNTGAQSQAIDPAALEKLAKHTRQTDLRKALFLEIASRENFAHLTELNQLFAIMDKNHDGSLQVCEIQEALEKSKMGEENIQKFLDCLADDASDSEAEVS